MEAISQAAAAVKKTVWGENTNTGQNEDVPRTIVTDPTTETEFNEGRSGNTSTDYEPVFDKGPSEGSYKLDKRPSDYEPVSDDSYKLDKGPSDYEPVSGDSYKRDKGPSDYEPVSESSHKLDKESSDYMPVADDFYKLDKGTSDTSYKPEKGPSDYEPVSDDSYKRDKGPSDYEPVSDDSYKRDKGPSDYEPVSDDSYKLNKGTSNTSYKLDKGPSDYEPVSDDSYKLDKGPSDYEPVSDDSYKRDKRPSDYKPEGPISTGGYPQGANLIGERGTNQNPHSNANEPNTGFGGIGAQPSIGVDPTSATEINQYATKHQGSGRPTEEPEPSSIHSGESEPIQSSSMGGMRLPESDNNSKSEGTGTLYEKSTGLHAEGGDFDATRPGAAREADRLMDDKGVRHGDTNPAGETGAPKKDKKWYGVDHSGFGGHGSHTNENRSSISKPSDIEEGDPRDSIGLDEHTEKKKGLAQKIKDKIHHSSSN